MSQSILCFLKIQLGDIHEKHQHNLCGAKLHITNVARMFFSTVQVEFFSEKNLSFCHTILVRCYNSRIYSRLTKVFVQEESVIICQTTISASKPPNYQTFSTFDRIAMYLSSIRLLHTLERVRVENA